MAASFKLADILVEINFKPVKNIRITVYPPDGRVCVSAPPDTAREAIKRFAASKMQWIKKTRERIIRLSKTGDKNHCSVWGVLYKMSVTEKPGRSKITLDSEVIKFHVPPNTAKKKKQQLLDKWYHRLIREAAPPLVQKWKAKIGVGVNKIYYRKMKTRWGSCNYRQHTIRLNTELAKKPPVCLEYVIVHELLHMIEPSHNKNFYRLMSRFVPNWKIIRKKMNAGEL